MVAEVGVDPGTGRGGGGRYGAPRATITADASAPWLRRAWPVVASHRAMFATAVLGSFAALVVQVQIPTVIGRAIDRALVARDADLTGYVWILVALGLVRWLLNTVSRTLLLTTAYRIEYDLRAILYEHLTRLSFSFYDRVQSGELMARANSDIRAVQMYLATAPVILAQCAVAVVVFAQMLAVDVLLAFVAVSTLPVVAVVGVQMRRRLFPVSWLVQSRLAEVATVVDENIQGVRVVKSFAAEEDQLRELYSAARRARWAVVQDAQLRARWSPVMENLPRLSQAMLLAVGGWMVYRGELSLGAIVTFNAYILMLQPPFRMLGLLMMMGQRARASAQRMYAVLDTPADIVDRPGAIDLLDARGEVHFDDVHFSYRDGTEVLSGFDLHLAPGETVALVGRSGSGKSTVARLVARFYDVDSGAVRLDGHDVRDLTVHSVRDHVGMVLDEPFLFSSSIRDNIAYGRPDAPFDEVVAAATAAEVHEFVASLPEGYDTVVGERGYTLSGGQRQRIAIARTLLVGPAVLVLDDATSAIDAQVEQRIHHALTETIRHRSTIIIGHRVSTIRLADRVVVLDEGRVVATGTHRELLAGNARYRAILAAVLDPAEADDLVEADGDLPGGDRAGGDDPAGPTGGAR